MAKFGDFNASEFMDGLSKKRKTVVTEMATKKVDKVSKLAERALKAVGGSKEKAVSLIYQVLEDANFHTENKQLESKVSKLLGDSSKWYQAYDKGDASSYAMALDWDSRVLDFGNKILSAIGITDVVLKLRDEEPEE